jgi:flagellar biosynthesis protein FlgN
MASQPPDRAGPEGAGALLPVLLEQLGELLQDELDALVHTHDPARIEQLAARKSELCAGIDSLQRELPGQDPAQAGRLRELTLAVARANQRNGAVVAALIRNTQGALDILRSIPAGESAAVYGPRGQTLGAGKAKPLGSA